MFGNLGCGALLSSNWVFDVYIAFFFGKRENERVVSCNLSEGQKETLTEGRVFCDFFFWFGSIGEHLYILVLFFVFAFFF